MLLLGIKLVFADILELSSKTTIFFQIFNRLFFFPVISLLINRLCLSTVCLRQAPEHHAVHLFMLPVLF